MHLKTAIIAALVLGSAALPARAEFPTGNEMLAACEQFADHPQAMVFQTFSAGQCFGIMQGVWYASGIWCAPAGVTWMQSMMVMTHYLRQHPQLLHMELPNLAMMAFEDAWPCKRIQGS